MDRSDLRGPRYSLNVFDGNYCGMVSKSLWIGRICLLLDIFSECDGNSCPFSFSKLLGALKGNFLLVFCGRVCYFSGPLLL